VASELPRLDFWKMQSLTFEEPDMETFRGLKLAYEAGKAGGTMPCVLNGANEEAVAAFLAGKISFLKIYDIIEGAVNARDNYLNPDFAKLIEEDAWSRAFAREMIAKEL